MRRYKLEEVAEIYSGATPLTKEKRYYEGGTISWITPKDLSNYNHKYIYKGQRSITGEGFQSCATYKLPKGTVLFFIKGSYRVCGRCRKGIMYKSGV